MSLEDEINARLRHLSEEIRAFRENIDQFRRRDSRNPLGVPGDHPRDKTLPLLKAPAHNEEKHRRK